MQNLSSTLMLLAYGGLINLPEGGGAVQKFDDKAFDAVQTSGTYLPRLQLMTSNSEKCKGGEFPINNYALVSGESYTDVGKEVDLLIIAWRPKAMQIGEVILNCHDPEDPQFKQIVANSEKPDSGCMFGPEFLIYVPSKDKFATFLMGSKTARKEAPAVRALLQSAATLGSKKISTAKYTWYGPQCRPCSTPFTIPSNERILEELNKFNNPPKQEVEKAPETGTERAR